MRLLLDTHIVVWRVLGTRRLGPRAEAALEAASTACFSAVSFAEVGVKCAVGKLLVPEDFEQIVRESGLHLLDLRPEHGLAVAGLPLHHRDPFDRLLIAQAQAEGLTILTADPHYAPYDVAVCDAGV